jgi:hypothetical protein
LQLVGNFRKTKITAASFDSTILICSAVKTPSDFHARSRRLLRIVSRRAYRALDQHAPSECLFIEITPKAN